MAITDQPHLDGYPGQVRQNKEAHNNVNGEVFTVSTIKKNARVRIFLSKREYERFSFAATENGVSRSFIALEAIRSGLRNPDLDGVDIQRHCRLDVRVPEEFADALKNLVQMSGRSQQSILRLFLFRYVGNSPLKKAPEKSLIGDVLIES